MDKGKNATQEKKKSIALKAKENERNVEKEMNLIAKKNEKII